MKKIYTAPSLITIEILKAKLADSGIKTLIKNANPPAAGEVTPMVAWPELWILDENQQSQAQSLIDENLNNDQQPIWRCPNCHQEVDGDLKLCWACGESKPVE